MEYDLATKVESQVAGYNSGITIVQWLQSECVERGESREEEGREEETEVQQQKHAR